MPEFMQRPVIIDILPAVSVVQCLIAIRKHTLNGKVQALSVIRHYLHGLNISRLRPFSLPANSGKGYFPRVFMENTMLNVTDGSIFSTASRHNISRAGICLTGLHENMCNNSGQLTLFTPKSSNIPVLTIKPRWEKHQVDGKSIGEAL